LDRCKECLGGTRFGVWAGAQGLGIGFEGGMGVFKSGCGFLGFGVGRCGF